MRKVVIHKAGGYDRLRVEEHPTPSPAKGEVLVSVEAAGINYADISIRMGLYASAQKYVGWPITPGFEVAGTVAAVGEGVTQWKEGDDVLAVTRFGGYTSDLVVPEHQVFAIPDGFSKDEAAGFPTVFLTAYYALVSLADVQAGQNVLVHSAAGGVGSSLLQLGRIKGARSVGVVGRSNKVEVAEKFGADVVIDKSTQDLWKVAKREAPEGYQVVLDANGVSTLGESYNHLAPTGRLVVYGFASMLPKKGGRPNWLKLAWDWLRTPRFNPLDMTTDNKSVMAFNLSYLFDHKEVLAKSMDQLLGWCYTGEIKPSPVTTYALEDVAQAHKDIESSLTVGKLVLKP